MRTPVFGISTAVLASYSAAPSPSVRTVLYSESSAYFHCTVGAFAVLATTRTLKVAVRVRL